MASAANWAKMGVSAGGTGDITLASASGFPTFAQAFGTGSTSIEYTIVASGLRETGTATYNGTTHVLSGRTVTQSWDGSAYGTAAIDVPTTGVEVFSAPTVQTVATLTGGQTLTNKTLTAPTINGGDISGITDLAVADGGTGASTAANARTNLGLGTAATMAGPTGDIVGTSDAQTLTNKTLTTPTIGSFTNATHTHQNSAGGGTLDAAAIGSGTLPITRGGTGGDSASAARTALGLAVGSDVQAYSAKTAAIAALTWAANQMAYFTGAATAAVTDLSSFARTLLDDADASAARTTLGFVEATTDQVLSDLGLGEVGFHWFDPEPVDGTYTWDEYVSFAGEIDEIVAISSAGTGSIAVKINGTNVTGLATVAVSSVQNTDVATAANTFVVGDRLTFVLSSASSLANMALKLRTTRTP